MAADRKREYARLIGIASKRYGIAPHVLAGLIEVESGFDPNARSPAGAMGITQFMPGTAKGYGVRFGASHGAVASQILGAARYLKDLGYHSNRTLALAKYNAGPGNPGAGMGYARDVLGAAGKYFHQGFGAAGGKGGGGGSSGGGTVTVTNPTSSRDPITPGGTGLVDLLKSLRDREQAQSAPQAQPISPPAFTAQASMPKGYQDISSGPPAPDKTPLSELLSQVQQGQGIAHTQVTPGSVSGGGGGSSGGGGRGGGGVTGTTKVSLAPGADRSGVSTSHYLRRQLSTIPGIPGGITITTGSNHNRLTVDGNVSDHWTGHAADIAVPVDSRRGDLIAGRALMTLGGIPRAKARQMARQGGLYTFKGRDGKRYQVIWKTNAGGNHHNHVHVGVR